MNSTDKNKTADKLKICSKFECLEKNWDKNIDLVPYSLDSLSINNRREIKMINTIYKQNAHSNIVDHSKTIDLRVYDFESSEAIIISNDDANIFGTDYTKSTDKQSITNLKREDTFYENCQHCKKCGHSILRIN